MLAKIANMKGLLIAVGLKKNERENSGNNSIGYRLSMRLVRDYEFAQIIMSIWSHYQTDPVLVIL